MKQKNLDGLMKKIDYVFKDKTLLQQAMTHASVVGEANNERLEFLGDAVLELIATDYLYREFFDNNEGDLSRLRAIAVQENALYQAAIKIRLGDYLILGIGEDKSGGREKPSILSDAYEALIGALYLDGGIEIARKLVLKELPLVIKEAIQGKTADYKTMLQEYLQREGNIEISYQVIGITGPDHHREFCSQLFVNQDKKTTGYGPNKKAAEQEAAKNYLKQVQIETVE